MTSTQIYKNQVNNIFNKLRVENDNKEFQPTHMGGLPGQRDILISRSVMRETEVYN